MIPDQPVDLTLKDIRALNIEPTSRCVGKCPFCSRTQKVRPYGNHTISHMDFMQLPEELIRSLRKITFAGNFGDFSSNSDMPAIASHIRRLNRSIVLGAETNGSVQNESWWASLGPHFRNGCIEFALDGLRDTHSLHRVGTDFHKIIENIRAFTAAGGTAHWKFILFKHNAHQVKESEALAERIGCKRFFVISSRDYNDILSRPEFIHFQVKRDLFRSLVKALPLENERAACRPFYSGTLYIAADGTVHPCCFAHCMYITEHNHAFRFIVPLIDKYRSEINFKVKPLQDIIKSRYFREVLEQSGNNAYCRMKCNQFKNRIRQDLILHDVGFSQRKGVV